MIDKVTFIMAMNTIKVQMDANNTKQKKLIEVLGDTEQINEMFETYPMVRLLENICHDNYGFISMYIYETDWGEYPYEVVDKSTGIKLPCKTISNLYDILTYSQPWDLEWRG